MTTMSVVIPSRNDAVMLRSCLAALEGQTRPADEIIVVDNASSDDTAAVALAAGALLVSEPVVGVLAATAAGFSAATGDIIARLDADSVPPPDWLWRVENILAAVNPLGIVTGPGDFYDANRLVMTIGRKFYVGGYFTVIGALLGHPPLFGSNLAMHERVWERMRQELDLHLPRVHDDMHLSFRVTPEMTVIYDATLRVGISARPFSSLRGLGRRFGWAGITLWVNRRLLPRRARRSRTAPAGRG